jgi:phosphoribosylglycinamide formyltransferase-1
MPDLHARGGQPPGGPGGVSDPLRVGVLASGRGSNLQAILDAARRPAFPARVAVVVSDREGAPALGRASSHGVPAVFLNPKDAADGDAYDAAVGRVLEEHRVGLVCLAGFMRILGPGFVRVWRGRLMNVHPALLPAFPGLHAQRQALEYGVKITGATIHFVDEGLDTGPIILQSSVPVEPGDTEAALAGRILAEEHRLYPEAVRLFAEGRLRIVGRRVILE